MNSNSDQYNIAAIRNLLKDAFTAQDLWRFCQERPDFQPVLVHVSHSASLAEMIDTLTQYCQTQLLFDELLLAVREVNLRQYERYQAQLYRGGTVSLPTPQIPENLDPRSEFVGRQAEKAEVHEALRRSRLVCIEGIGGIGKTALALEVAHDCLQASQDSSQAPGIVTFAGFVWASAKDRDLDLDDLLNTVARTLDYVGIAQKPHDEKRVAVYDLLRAKSYLLIVDNYETITDEDVRDFLLKLSERSKVLITSRKREWVEAEVIALSDLSRSESLELMRRTGHRLKLGAVEQAHDEDLLSLYYATGGVPLAIKWAIGQIKQKGQSLDSAAALLQGAHADIFEDVFGRSWKLLSTDSRQVLMFMPLFVSPVTREVIGAVSDLHSRGAVRRLLRILNAILPLEGTNLFLQESVLLDKAVGQLVEMSLLDTGDGLRPRFSIHPLTRALAWKRLQRIPGLEEQFRRRTAQFFLELTQTCGGSRTNWTEYGKVEQELPNIISIAGWCFEKSSQDRSCGQILIQFGWSLRNIFWTQCYWREGIDLFEKVIEVADGLRDLKSIGWRAYDVGWLHSRFDVEEAQRWAKRSLQAFETLDHKRGIGFANHLLGCMARDAGEYDLAEEYLTKALRILDQYGKKAADTIVVKLGLGIMFFHQDNLDEAERLIQEVIGSGDRFESRATSVFGSIHLRKGNLVKAKECFDEGILAAGKVGRKDVVAYCSYGLAQVHELRGEYQQAYEEAAYAANIFERLGLQNDCPEAQVLADRLWQRLPAIVEESTERD